MSDLKPFIPVWFDELDLSRHAFRILANLWRRRNLRTGQCNPTAETIAKDCGFRSAKHVWKYLREIENAGLMKRKKRRFAGENHYELIIPITPKKGAIGETLSPP